MAIFGIAQGDQAEGQRAAHPPMAAPSGMKVKNTSIAVISSKFMVLRLQARRARRNAKTAPPNAPNSRPSKASNTIFIRLTLVAISGAGLVVGNERAPIGSRGGQNK